MWKSTYCTDVQNNLIALGLLKSRLHRFIQWGGGVLCGLGLSAAVPRWPFASQLIRDVGAGSPPCEILKGSEGLEFPEDVSCV